MWARLLSLALIGSVQLGLSQAAAPSPAPEPSWPIVQKVESQPLLAQVRRLSEAMDFIGAPLSEKTKAGLDAAARLGPGGGADLQVQALLDPLCLGAVTIHADGVLAFTPSTVEPTLNADGWRPFLIKVINESGITSALRVDSLGALPSAQVHPDQPGSPWLQIESMERRPMSPALSGLGLEYRIVQLHARGHGKRRALLAFALEPADRVPARVSQPPVRRWNFDRGLEEWRESDDCLLETRGGVLQITRTGNAAYFGANTWSDALKAPFGEVVLRLRARMDADALWKVEWANQTSPPFSTNNRASFPVRRSEGRWQDYSVSFTTESELNGLWLSAGTNWSRAEIDRIEIASVAALPRWHQTSVTFRVERSREVTLRVRDEYGQPTTAAFVITDASGHVYPLPSKRLAPDLFFQQQIYRSDGESLRLPRGTYSVHCSRGPEYLPQKAMFSVSDRKTTWTFDLQRWIDPAKFGYWSGDHHIHAAGCAHYTRPTEGVRPEDMARYTLGEDLKVGCNLTWGPCFDYQKRFFTGKDHPASRPPYLLHYDIEVSGFGSHSSGHLCLLRLKHQIPPGGGSKYHWPSLGLNTLRWAKKQGAVCGPAHSGFGLEVDSTELPNYQLPPFNGVGAQEYIVDVTHEVPGPDGRLVPAVDFMSAVDTPHIWELNIWYHTLNTGFRTRLSGETDFPCIFGERVGIGRSYVKLDGPLNYYAWCEAIRDGRSYVGDGRSHLLEFSARNVPAPGEHTPVALVRLGEQGSELRLTRPGLVRFDVKAAARLDEISSNPPLARHHTNFPPASPYWHIERARLGATREVPVELIVNGYPVAATNLLADGTLRELTFQVPIPRSSWVALRILPSSHTNPVWVQVGEKPVRASRRSAEWCLKSVDQCWDSKKQFILPNELAEAEAAYEHARQTYRRILAECEVD